MSEAPLKMALIGAGGIGKTHLASYAKIPEAALIAVCDANPAAAQAAADSIGARVYTDAARMLEDLPDLQAVDICTPTAAHREPALQAIQRGLHVLCEKPLADSPAAAKEMVDAAWRAGVLLMNAFCHRFHPEILFVRGLIDSGEMGEVVMFRNRFAGPAPNMDKSWFSKKALAGGGALLDTSIHSVDLFRFLVGEATRVQAVTRQTNPSITEVEDTGIVLLSTADLRMGTVEACWSAAGGYNVVEVYGTKGAAMVHYWDGMSSRYQLQGMDDWKRIPSEGTDRFTAEITHFVNACLGRDPLQVTGDDGLRAVEIIFQAYAAADR